MSLGSKVETGTNPFLDRWETYLLKSKSIVECFACRRAQRHQNRWATWRPNQAVYIPSFTDMETTHYISIIKYYAIILSEPLIFYHHLTGKLQLEAPEPKLKSKQLQTAIINQINVFCIFYVASSHIYALYTIQFQRNFTKSKGKITINVW